MLSALKQRLEAKKSRARAIAASGYWKTHGHLQECLQALLQLVLETLDNVTAVAPETYLVSGTMTRIVRCDHWGKCQLYSIEPEA